MLERVPICLEPTAALLLRRFEQPLRSRRNLDPLFWRNHGDTCTAAQWWPGYLADLRAATDQPRLDHAHSNNLFGNHAPVLKSGQRRRRPNTRQADPDVATNSSRNFSRAASLRQQTQSVQHHDEHEINEDGLLRHEDSGRRREQAQDQSFEGEQAKRGSTRAQHSKELRSRFEALLHPRKEDYDYDQIWRTFNLLRHQENYASRVLEVLHSSQSEIDQDRIMKSFLLISLENRSERDYEVFIHACIKRRQFSLATRTNVEASSYGVGIASSRALLSFFVQHGLWRNAANLFPSIKPCPHPGNTATTLDQAIWSVLDDMTDLPARILDLTARLCGKDALLLEQEQTLLSFGQILLRQMLDSSQILGQITVAGLLSIMDNFFELGITKDYYYRALDRLHKLGSTRNRSELAIALYRNVRYRYSKSSTPSWVFGMLISMCRKSGRPVQTYLFLLDDFRGAAGKPDIPAYSAVMDACAYQGEKDILQQVFDTFCNDYGRPFNLEQAKPLLYVYARLGDPENAIRVLGELGSKYNLRPDTACWNMVLLAYTRSDEPLEAFTFFARMQKEGIKLDSHTFGTLMGVSANRGDVDGTLALVDMARKAQIPGNAAMLDTLVEAYCRVDDIRSAKDLAEAAIEMRLPGSLVRMWNILLRYHASHADSEAVLATQTRMRELGIKPDGMTYAALMTALIMLGKTNDATKILRSLHLSQNMQASQFHYSIVLRGYVQEGNRDMVNVIYNEITQRFPRLNPSARLSMLRAQLQRDQDKAQQGAAVSGESLLYLDEGRAKSFLADLLLDISTTDSAVSEPQPGFGRRQLSQTSITPYLESYLRILYACNSWVEADKLLHAYDDVLSSLSSLEGRNLPKPVELWTFQLQSCRTHSRWTEADEAWENILMRAVKLANAIKPADALVSQKRPVQALPKSDHNLQPTLRAWHTILNKKNVSVLPAQRHLLSLPLYHYMLALDAQGEHTDIVALVERLQHVGFALTSLNWNTYVQVLSKSKNPNHWLIAFRTFEERLLPQASTWREVLRGEDKSESPEVQRHRALQKLNSDVATPAYTTLVFLTNALFRTSATPSGKLAFGRIREEAAGTIRFIKRMPYRPDRLQGVLLRGRSVRRDLLPRLRRPPEPNRAGIVGSTSVLDHVPIGLMSEIEAYFSPKAPDIRRRLLSSSLDTEDSPVTPADLEQAEKVAGEIYWSPAALDAQDRSERPEEQARRIQKEIKAREAVVRELRKDINRPRLIADPQIGDPIVDTFHLGIDNDEPAVLQPHDVLTSDADSKAVSDSNKPTNPDTAAETTHPPEDSGLLRQRVARLKRRSAYYQALRMKPALRRAGILSSPITSAYLKLRQLKQAKRVSRHVRDLLDLRRSVTSSLHEKLKENHQELALTHMRKYLGNTTENLISTISALSTRLDQIIASSQSTQDASQARLLQGELKKINVKIGSFSEVRRRIFKRGTRRRKDLKQAIEQKTEELDSIVRKLKDADLNESRRALLARDPKRYANRAYRLHGPVRAVLDTSFTVSATDRLRMRLSLMKQSPNKAKRFSGARYVSRKHRQWLKRKIVQTKASKIMKQEEAEEMANSTLPSEEEVQRFLAETQEASPNTSPTTAQEDDYADIVDVVNDGAEPVFKPFFAEVQDHGYGRRDRGKPKVEEISEA